MKSSDQRQFKLQCLKISNKTEGDDRIFLECVQKPFSPIGAFFLGSKIIVVPNILQFSKKPPS